MKQLLIFALLCFVGCGSCGDENNAQNNSVPDTDEPDMQVETDVDVVDDVTVDNGTVDMGPVDSDGDGILDDVDNCPDLANVDQLDRDRDGVGDLCDHFPFISDPSNPDAFLTIEEDESVIPNDNGDDGEAYNAEVPFIMNGGVGPVEESGGDLDWYTFEIEQPTAMIVRLEPNEQTWVGAIVVGRDFRNANVFKTVLAPMAGEPIDREIFLAAPGQYSIILSDVQNFVGNLADVGGPNYEYTASISTIPLPAAETLELPIAPFPQTFINTLRVYEVDVTGVDAIHLESIGNPVDQNAFHNPALALVDVDTDRTIAFTGLAEVGDDQKVEIDAQLVGVNRVRIIEDITERFGSTSSSIVIRQSTLTNEIEQVVGISDQRFQPQNWVMNGSTIRGRIDSVRDDGTADRDYYLFQVVKGDHFKVTVQPDAGGLLRPGVRIGHFVNNQGTSSFMVAEHGAELVEVPEDPTVVEYYIDSAEEGEFAIEVIHDLNNGAPDPAGGPQYGYELKIEPWTPVVTDLGAIPAIGTVEMGNGSLGVVSFDAPAEVIVTASLQSTTVSPDTRVVDPTDWSLVKNGNRALTFKSDAAATYRLDIRDFLGRGTAGAPIELSITTSTPTDLGALPAVVTGVLDPEPRHYYTFQATEGEVLDVRVGTENFFPDLTIYNEAFEDVVFASRDRVFIAPYTGTYIIEVGTFSANGDPAFTYTLGVQNPVPAQIATLPSTQSETIASAPFGDWYAFDVTAGADYEVRFAAENFFPRLTVYAPDTLATVTTGIGGRARWRAAEDATVWVLVANDRNLGDPTFDYDLVAQTIAAQPLAAGNLIAGSIANLDATALYEIDAPPGAIDIKVNTVGDWRPKIDLLEETSLRRVSDASQFGGRLIYAQSLTTKFLVAVEVLETAIVGPYSFTIEYTLVDSGIAANEVEPNDVENEAQTVTPTGAILGATLNNDDDRFAVGIEAGQRIWALTTDRNNNGVNRFDARLQLVDGLQTVVTSNQFGGEGFLPAIRGYQAAQSGNYQVIYGPDNNGTLTGDYALFFILSEVVAFAQSEPNNDLANAQVAPSFTEGLNFDGFVDAGDPFDFFSFDVVLSNSKIDIYLDGADPGHTLRLLDSTGAEILASGPGYDGLQAPMISYTSVTPATYVVEFGQGTASGSGNVVVIKTP